MAFNIPIPSHPIPNFLTYSHSHGILEYAILIPSHSYSHSNNNILLVGKLGVKGIDIWQVALLIT